MKVGDSVGGYVVTQPFTNQGGGQSEWTFAKRDGKSYFLKRFLQPTFPVPDGPGSPRTKEVKRLRCAAFESHQQQIQALLKPLSTTGGNLVVSRAFFRQGAHYFKVTDRIDTKTLALAKVAALPLRDQIGLLLSVSHSLGILHRNKLVHGDIKPANLLLQRNAAGLYGTKLIDFDNCFQSGSPPSPDDMVGDPSYYSPEMMAYLNGEAEAGRITQASDIFALGVVFTQYLTAAMPGTGGRAHHLGEALLAGGSAVLPPLGAGARFGDLLGSMLDSAAERRPTLEQISEELKKLRKGTEPAPGAGTGSGGPFGSVPPSGLRGALGAPALRGKLLKQTEKKSHPPD
jgi:eukaryotic-like serine/threonine-protein kinase